MNHVTVRPPLMTPLSRQRYGKPSDTLLLLVFGSSFHNGYQPSESGAPENPKQSQILHAQAVVRLRMTLYHEPLDQRYRGLQRDQKQSQTLAKRG